MYFRIFITKLKSLSHDIGILCKLDFPTLIFDYSKRYFKILLKIIKVFNDIMTMTFEL